MKASITGRHVDVTDALRAYIENGLQKLRTHFDRVIDADVVLTIEKHRHIAEMNLHANGVRINGKESSSDMYASVDAVLDKLDKQIRKFKDRINRHQPRNERETRKYHYQIIEMLKESAETPEPAVSPKHRVVFRERVPLKPMNVEEATMQLELIDEPFLVFSNADTEQVNVIYAREDGTYGLIEPQF